jgi:two-component system, OmpR family, copper resistance phosphate regulon response regulator CusR
MRMQILVIEDDEKLARSLEEGLQAEDYTVAMTRTGEDGFYLASRNRFDVVLLDIMLPGRNGLEIQSTIRQMGLRIPILVLTAKDTVDDHFRGLNAGADDYLVKPFAFPELLARIRALVRRGNIEEAEPLKYADLELDVVTHVVRRAGVAISLTVREFEILAFDWSVDRTMGHCTLKVRLTVTAFTLCGELGRSNLATSCCGRDSYT